MLTITIMIIVIFRVILRQNTSRPTLPRAMAIFRPGADRQQNAVCQQPGSVPTSTQFMLSVSLLLFFVIQCASVFFVQTVFCTRDHFSPEDFMKLFTTFRWLLLSDQRPFPQFLYKAIHETIYWNTFVLSQGLSSWHHSLFFTTSFEMWSFHAAKREGMPHTDSADRQRGSLCSLSFLSHKMPPGAFW